MKHWLGILAIAIIHCASSNVFAQNGVWLTYTTLNSNLTGDSVTRITFDQNQSLWLGTRFGIDRLSGATWTHFDHSVLPSTDIFDLAYTNSKVWIANRSGVTSFDGSQWTTYTSANSGLVSGLPVCLAADNQSRLWVGTARGMSRIMPDLTWDSYTVTNTPAMPYNGIQALTTDANSNLWISFISTRGIVEFPGGNSQSARYIKQDSIPGFPNAYIVCLAVDWAGNLWAGTTVNGVVKIDQSGATVFSTQTTGALKSNNVHRIAVDNCGNVWIATDGGASMYNGSSWKTFSKSSGNLPGDIVPTVTIDGSGHIWFGTQSGVTEFKPLPQTPYLLYPAMSATVATDSLTCTWAWDCPGVLKYWHEVADNPNFTNSKIDTTSPSLMQSASKWDTALVNHQTYYWRVKAENDAGWGPFSDTWTFTVNMPSGVAMHGMAMPRCTLAQNFPNPCSDRSTIGFSMPERSNMSLKVYDVLGRECATIMQSDMGPGTFNVTIDAASLPRSGVYVYRLKAGNDIEQRTMQVVR